MIQANEIRYGNFYNRKHGKGWTETKIDGDILSKIFGQSLEYALNDFEPIPVTSEVLLACGCELSPDKEHYFLKHHGFCLLFDGEDWCLKMRADDPCLILYFKYLHQFQNVYLDLTKTELVYNP